MDYFLSCFAKHSVWAFGFFVIILVIQTSIPEPLKTFYLCLGNLSLIGNKSVWYWFLKLPVWLKNVNIISHGLKATNGNFCVNFASGQKKTQQSIRLRARPRSTNWWFWFWIKCEMLLTRERDGARGTGLVRPIKVMRHVGTTHNRPGDTPIMKWLLHQSVTWCLN